MAWMLWIQSTMGRKEPNKAVESNSRGRRPKFGRVSVFGRLWGAASVSPSAFRQNHRHFADRCYHDTTFLA